MRTPLERVKAAAAGPAADGWMAGEIGANVLEDRRGTRAVLQPITGDRPLVGGRIVHEAL